MDVSGWLPVNVGLKQRCVMFSCLFDHFNVYMDRDTVVREVIARVPGKRLKQLSSNVSMFEIIQLLFADDIALVAVPEEKLC